MKRMIFTVLTILSLNSVAFASENEPEGFRGIKWGTAFSKHSTEMVLKEKNIYTRKGDQMTIGGAKLKELSYFYYKGQFSGVFVETVGIQNEQALIAALRAQFGAPSQPNQFMEQYLWDGAITSIVASCSSVTHVCGVLFQSQELSKVETADKQKIAEKGKKDF
jgi:hypothetical protein